MKIENHMYHKGLSYFEMPKKLKFFTALSGHLKLLDENKSYFDPEFQGFQATYMLILDLYGMVCPHTVILAD